MKVNELKEICGKHYPFVRDLTPEEEADFLRVSQPTVEEQINELKQKLADTDYQAIKYAEGITSAEEYAPIKAQREQWRAEINKLEESVCQ